MKQNICISSQDKVKAGDLLAKFHSQRRTLLQPSTAQENATRASYRISTLALSCGDFVKQCLTVAAETVSQIRHRVSFKLACFGTPLPVSWRIWLKMSVSKSLRKQVDFLPSPLPATRVQISPTLRSCWCFCEGSARTLRCVRSSPALKHFQAQPKERIFLWQWKELRRRTT